MTAHRSQSTATPASAIGQWSGTAAEWDAERELIIAKLRGAIDEYCALPANGNAEYVPMLAESVMPPRPVEPPSVVTGLGWSVEWDGTFFSARQLPKEHHALHDRRAHTVAAYVGATDAEFDAIRALRDGPTARYVEDGWRFIHKDGIHAGWRRTEQEAKETCTVAYLGGTAHAIYKRVGEA